MSQSLPSFFWTVNATVITSPTAKRPPGADPPESPVTSTFTPGRSSPWESTVLVAPPPPPGGPAGPRLPSEPSQAAIPSARAAQRRIWRKGSGTRFSERGFMGLSLGGFGTGSVKWPLGRPFRARAAGFEAPRRWSIPWLRRPIRTSTQVRSRNFAGVGLLVACVAIAAVVEVRQRLTIAVAHATVHRGVVARRLRRSERVAGRALVAHAAALIVERLVTADAVAVGRRAESRAVADRLGLAVAGVAGARGVAGEAALA